MKNIRLLVVGMIACLFLILLSVSCDTDKGADIQSIERNNNNIQKIDKGEIDNDDI